jgi:cation diffusion facilitator CzcD-associated flavoprotein CzcO
MTLLRWLIFWRNELLFFVAWDVVVAPLKTLLVNQVVAWKRRTVNDPDVAEKLVPKYEFACKRITFSDDYLAVRFLKALVHTCAQVC